MSILCDLYLRLSDGRRENGSFAERESKLRERAGQLGWTVRGVVIENDMMNGSKSASAFKRRTYRRPDGQKVHGVYRPGFRQILDDLGCGAIGGFIAEDLDRAMRDPRDLEDLIDVCERTRCSADSMSGSLRLTSGGTDAEITMARLMVTIANKSSRDTARRVTEARERQAKGGVWGGGRRPYGFRPVPSPAGGHQNTRLEVDPVEAAVIRKMADAVLAGVPLRSLARDLNEGGVPTARGLRWTSVILRDVLRKPSCAGLVVHHGQPVGRLDGEAILAEDTWRAVVARLEDPTAVVTWTDERGNERSAVRGTNAGRAPCWLGSGLYRCVCGSVVEIGTGSGRAPAYRCARDGGTGEVHIRRNAAALDAHVAKRVIAWASRPDALALLMPAAPTVDAHALRTEAAAQRALRDELVADRTAGRIPSRTAYLKALDAANARLAEIERQLASATKVSALFDLAAAPDVRAAWEAKSLGTKRAILVELMEVRVLPSRRGSGFDPEAVDCTVKLRKRPQ